MANMLDNLEQLELQLARLRGRLDGREAARQLERDHLLKEFPKMDMLKQEAKRVNGGWMPYDSRYNFSRKDDLVDWIVKETIPDLDEVIAAYHETKERINALKVGLTHQQWNVINSLKDKIENSHPFREWLNRELAEDEEEFEWK